MSDADNIEMQGSQESLEAAAFKKAGYNRTVFKAKTFIKQTFGGVVKGGLIGAAALAGLAVVGVTVGLASIPFVGPAASIAGLAGLFTTTMGQGLLLTAATTGATMGAGVGGLFKGITATSNLDEMADDEEQRIVMKYQRAQQAEINHKQMQLNQEIARANAKMGAQGMGMSPAATPQTTLAQNQGFGMGMGGKV